MKLSGRTVLITGGTSGIGLALANELAGRGNQVIVTGRDLGKLDAGLRDKPNVAAIESAVDVKKDREELVERIEREFPTLDILVNNAGIMRQIDLVEDRHFEPHPEIMTNLLGPIELTRLLLPRLLEQATASIVNVSTGLAYVPFAVVPIYCAAKAGLHSFSQSLRYQLRGTSITVHEVLPPPVDTALLPPDFEKPKPITAEACASSIVRGLSRDRSEIRIGVTRGLYHMARLTPRFAHRMLNASSG